MFQFLIGILFDSYCPDGMVTAYVWEKFQFLIGILFDSYPTRVNQHYKRVRRGVSADRFFVGIFWPSFFLSKRQCLSFSTRCASRRSPSSNIDGAFALSWRTLYLFLRNSTFFVHLSYTIIISGFLAIRPIPIISAPSKQLRQRG